MSKADSFIPGNPTSGSDAYLNMKALDGYPDKTVRVRILCVPFLTGYEWWTKSKKPIRRADGDSFPSNEEYQPDANGNPSQPRRFWATVVWNLNEKKMQVWVYSQGSVTKELRKLAEDSDWGNPTGYDVKVKRSGSGMDTEYGVIPCPKSPVPKDVLAEWTAMQAGWSGLEALFAGGNPFDSPTTGKPAHDKYAFPEDNEGLPYDGTPPPDDDRLPF